MSKSFYRPPECTILITGCSSGIGLYCATTLASLGYNVIATARKIKDVQTLKTLGLQSFQLDLNNSTSIKLALKQILALTNGRLDVLFNNAGFGQPGAVEDLNREVMRAQFETNVFGTMELTNQVIAIMRKQGHGKIIQNSSILGFVSFAFRGAYNASKHALEAFSDTLRIELHQSGIEIATIEPGPIRSDFRKNAYHQFIENIDAKNSHWATSYRSVQARLEASEPNKEDPFTLGPQAVLDKVLKIIKSKRAKPKYYVTKPTYIFGMLKRILTTRMLDCCIRLVSKSELKIKEST